MPLQFDDGTAFAVGATPYLFKPVTASETSNRILLPISIGDFFTSAFVDTGGVYLLCPPEIADQTNLETSNHLGETALTFRGTELWGTLYRFPITFHAEIGQSLSQEVTVFVPHRQPSQEWPRDFPCILGMQSCLEYLRFAVDPAQDYFYFGGLSE